MTKYDVDLNAATQAKCINMHELNQRERGRDEEEKWKERKYIGTLFSYQMDRLRAPLTAECGLIECSMNTNLGSNQLNHIKR